MRSTRGRPIVSIHFERCNGCGACVLVCRAGCLDYGPFPNARGDVPVRYAGAGCLGDGGCVRVCPVPGAVEMKREALPALLTSLPAAGPA